jgi:phosphohistidine phosphatase
VILVGHNPAIEELAIRLCATGDELPRLRQKYPTCGLAEIELPAGAWLEVGEQTGELTRFVIPRDLGA